MSLSEEGLLTQPAIPAREEKQKALVKQPHQAEGPSMADGPRLQLKTYALSFWIA